MKNYFFKPLLLFICTFIFICEKPISRELSIKEIEQRKQEDLKRELERKKRGKKKFVTEIKLSTKLVFLTKERKIPPVLSNLDPILDDEGFYGVKLGIEDNLTTGYFLGHDYKIKMVQVSLEENLIEEFLKLRSEGFQYFLLDLNAQEILELTSTSNSEDIIFFNLRSNSDVLREKNCKENLFHVAPSNAILADSLTQYLIKKKWNKWFLITGPDNKDREFSEALKKSAIKFNVKIKEERVWDFSSDLRRTAQKEVPIFTKGVKYDILVVSDVKGEFGEYLNFRTWDPRPIAGTQGLKPTSWHRTHEQWGATQMQNRFRRESGRWMTPVDYAAWVGVRAIGEAVTRTSSNDINIIKKYLISENFGIGAYKGVKVSFRKWDRQLRQPVLLASPRSMVSVSPQEGYLHPVSELDTLGLDEAESTCKLN